MVEMGLPHDVPLKVALGITSSALSPVVEVRTHNREALLTSFPPQNPPFRTKAPPFSQAGLWYNTRLKWLPPSVANFAIFFSRTTCPFPSPLPHPHLPSHICASSANPSSLEIGKDFLNSELNPKTKSAQKNGCVIIWLTLERDC